MGHVDHGKTSLLDAIRTTEVAAGEAGGITQHIGAYQVHHEGRTITFLDTPGHQAFTAMRARGAKVTDVAIVVVAADDGVMPQTVEAIDHAKAADVPVMIAVNKIDKEGATPDKVRGELANLGLQPEDWGGETVYCDVSAKTHEGLDNLLHMILLVTELEDLKANPGAEASGTVIESHLDPGRGAVVTILVQRGTLRVGDSIVAGSQWGRVRAMHDFNGNRIKEAGPGDPVEVLGFDGVGEAGERAQVVENDRRARQLAGERAIRLKTEAQARRNARRITLEDVFAKAKQGEIKQINLLAQGRRLRLARGAPGRDREAAAGRGRRRRRPRRRGRDQRVRRDAGRRLRRDHHRLQRPPARRRQARGRERGRRDPHLLGDLQDHRGAARRDGGHARARRGRALARRGRDPRAVQGLEDRHDRRLARHRGPDHPRRRGARSSATAPSSGPVASRSLRRFKDDVREVEEGQECGITLDGFQDVKVGDVLEVFETTQVEKTLG